jgi:2-polyprenyl-3-methyl-5-hydroxy-6-metoxy-1,4-benzoquinol methylase
MDTTNDSNGLPATLFPASSFNKNNTRKQRLDGLVGNCYLELNKESALATFFCNIRAFKSELFKVWRYPNCQTSNCLDVVDIDEYYAKFPFAEAQLTWPYQIIYRRLCGQLKKHRFSQMRSLLDYGCANGLFMQYLQQNGFGKCYGYDPYAPSEGVGNPATLAQGLFDYILLQGVIEHVENPHVLLSDLNRLLGPRGYIFIGTPNTAKIDLNRPNISDYYNPIHVPYHLHTYTRESLDSLALRQGWKPVEFCHCAFSAIRWLCLNTRTWNQYQRLLDGTLNVIFGAIKPWQTLTSFQFLFYAFFDYLLSLHTEMTIVSRKPF